MYPPIQWRDVIAVSVISVVLLTTVGLAVLVWKVSARTLEAVIISSVAILVLTLGVFHFTHHGVPSGILETTTFVLLLTTVVLALRRR